MKKIAVMIAVMVLLSVGALALAEENPFVGRWNEDGELASSITLRSDGSCEGSLMLFYEMKGSYSLNDSNTATLHIESVNVASGLEEFFSGSSVRALQKQLDGAQLVLTDEGTLSFLDMKMFRDESYVETDVVNDGKIEGQWELKNYAGQGDQIVLYFSPDGVVYFAYDEDGMIYEKPYSVNGTKITIGEGDTRTAVLQEDGSLKIEWMGVYVKTKAYLGQDFVSIAGLYGEERDGYLNGYYITPEGDLLGVIVTPDGEMSWVARERGLVMAGNRIGVHDEQGHRICAVVENGKLTKKQRRYDYYDEKWVNDDETYSLIYTEEEFATLMEFDSFTDDLPADLTGTYTAEGTIFVIYPDGTAVWNDYTWDDWKMTVKADGNRVLLFSEEPLGGCIMTRETDALIVPDVEQQISFTRISAATETGSADEAYNGLFDVMVESDGVTIMGFADGGDDVTELTIPATLYGLPVVAVEDNAFREKKQLTSVIIEEGVQTIGSGAFSYCSALETVVFPETMQSIEGNAFANCEALCSVTLPAGLTEVSVNLFSGCYLLESVVIPEGVTVIGGSSFAFCSSLEEIALPSTVNEIGHFAFWGTGLRSLFIPEGVEYFHASMIYETSQMERVYFPSSIKTIAAGNIPGDYRRQYYFAHDFISYMLNEDFLYSTELGTVVVMENYDAYGTDEMAYEVLEDGTARITSWFCETEHLVIPSEVDGIPITVIGKSVFAGNRSFSSVVIGEGITTIEPYAFYMTNAQTVVLPSTLKSIGTYAFHDTVVPSLYIPEGVETLEAFSLPSGLEEVYSPETVTNLHDRAGERIDVGYVFEGSAGRKFASQSWAYRQYYGCETYVLVEPGEITQAEDGSILRRGTPSPGNRACHPPPGARRTT